MISAQVTLVGNLGHEPEAKYTPQGTMVANGSLAVNSGYGENKTTDWYKLVVWGKMAELFKKLTKKGTTLLVVGRQRIRKWDDENGKEHTQIEVTVQEFNVLRNGADREQEHSDDEPEFMQD